MQELTSALNQIKTEADWVGLRQVTEKTSFRIVRDEKPERNVSAIDQGVMVEVLVDGHFGYAGTSDLTPTGLQRAARAAREMAQKAAPYKITSFSQQQRPATKGTFISPRERALDSTSLKEITDVLVKASGSLKVSDKIVSRLAMAMIVETDFKMISSSGADIHQNFSIVSSSFEATAQEGHESQIRSDGGGLARCLQTGAEVFNTSRIQADCERIGREALELLTAENCPSLKTDLILAPDQMTLQVHESIGHPLEYDRILGDERNYAGWSFVKPEDFGKLQYGAKLMNVTFDPTVRGEMASYLVDESGNPATREYLIKDGVLQRGLGSLESQARLKLPGVANFRASSWNRAPIDRMANINLEAGTSTLEDMIAATEKGVLMRSNKSWSIDDYRNKFQFGCEYAQLIENGRLTKTLKNPNYRGITVSFWNSLKMVGNKMEIFGSPYCGKGEPNQVIRVGHSTPYCLFGQVEVFGA
jgi:predicted Zn-dependent protease